MNLKEIDTPALLVDLDVMDRNLRRVADYCKTHRKNLRPHTKTHKTPEIARMQIQSGAYGITCAKVGEAELMVEAGFTDILIAYPVWGEQKLRRLTALAEMVRIGVSMDSPDAARGISAAAQQAGVTVDLLIEVDTGYGRCGFSKGEDVLSLAKEITDLPGVRFRGLMSHAAHIAGSPDPDKETARVDNLLCDCRDTLIDAEIPVPVISCGSTPILLRILKLECITEVRPGSYVFNDMIAVRRRIGWNIEDCALSVLVTVVSTTVSGQIIVDGGIKTFSNELLNYDGMQGYAWCRDDPGLEFKRTTEEHGIISLARAKMPHTIGERLHFIPNRVGLVVNLHERLYGVRNGLVETVWTVSGRGKLQ